MKIDNVSMQIMGAGAIGLALSISLFSGVAGAAESPLQTATKGYGDAAKELGAQGVNSLAKDMRKNERRDYLNEDLQNLLVRALYKRGGGGGAPAAHELLCWPQYSYKNVKDASSAIGLVGTRIGEISKTSGNEGLQLFLYELATDRKNPSDGAPTPIVKVDSNLIQNAGVFRAGSLFGEHASGPGQIGICDDGADRGSSSTLTMGEPERNAVCSCASVANDAAKFFSGDMKGPNETLALAAGAKFLQGIYTIFDRVFGIVGKRIEESRIRRDAYEYLNDEKTKESFKGATAFLRSNLDEASKSAQLAVARDYWKAYCTYTDARAHYVKIIEHRAQGGDIPVRPVVHSPPMMNSPKICEHLLAQTSIHGDLAFKAPDAVNCKDPASSACAEKKWRAAIASAHANMATSATALIERADGFDTAFDAKAGGIIKGVEDKYDELLKAVTPGAGTKAEHLAQLARETKWLLDTIVTFDEQYKLAKTKREEYEKALADKKEKQSKKDKETK